MRNCLSLSCQNNSHNGEHEDWARLSLQALGKAYGEHEPEYSLDVIKEPNPEYEGR
jgi:hypothetical protein